MIRGQSPDDICAMCDEFARRDVPPEYAELGMGICRKRVDTPIYPTVYVAWDGGACVSYRLDKPNLSARRQYVRERQQERETQQKDQ